MRNLRNDGERVVAGDEIATLAAQIDGATYRLLVLVRAFDTEEGWGFDGAQTCSHWLAWRVGWDLGTAREHVRVAHALADLPEISKTFEAGQVSYSKVRAMTRVATASNEALLLEFARHASGSQLERICSAYASCRAWDNTSVNMLAERRRVSRRSTADGLVSLTITMTPDEADRVTTAIDKAAKEHSVTDCRGTVNKVDGVVALAESFLGGKNPSRVPTEVIVSVSAGSLRDEATAQRLTCDAGLVAMVEDEEGQVVGVGRKTRVISASLKRALLKRDGGCTFPSCPNRMFVQGHHIKHWADGGPTELTNLVTLCSWHHRFLHEHGWSVRLDDKQKPTFYNQCGVMARPVVPLPWLTPLATNLSAPAGAHSEDPDYGLCTEALYRRDMDAWHAQADWVEHLMRGGDHSEST
jgi:hypothetical protein